MVTIFLHLSTALHLYLLLKSIQHNRITMYKAKKNPSAVEQCHSHSTVNLNRFYCYPCMTHISENGVTVMDLENSLTCCKMWERVGFVALGCIAPARISCILYPICIHIWPMTAHQEILVPNHPHCPNHSTTTSVSSPPKAL